MKTAPFLFKQIKDQILITNDAGRYAFLTQDEFLRFANEKLDESDAGLYEQLRQDFFLFDTSREKFLEDVKPELRAGKSYLFQATSLHIFVVTNYCNGKCVYCQAQSSEEGSRKMSREVAKQAVRIALQSPSPELNFEFQGGEPLSNFPIIRFIVEYTESVRGDKNVHYSVVSNLTLLTDEMIAFFQKYQVSVSTSLDGDRWLHMRNRPLANGKNSYDLLRQKLRKLDACRVYYGAIQTTTRQSLSRHREIIGEYRSLGLDTVFIRPLTPLGYAWKRWDEIGYTPDEFLTFYRNCLFDLLEENQAGHFMKEGHASIFLSKILNGYGLNYMELRSPCGAAVGQMAYYYDGNIFTCDEGRMLYEMGDDSFRLGSVTADDYDSLMNSKLCRTVCRYSVIESLPKCCDCAYQPYCGTCPVINYALERDVMSRTYQNYRCQMYQGMLDIIFELLLDGRFDEILRSWVE
jgi:His-Xaa-Ser system radical SAM maturase HxsB